MGYLHTATLRIGDAEVLIRVCSESDDPDDVFGEWFGAETMRPDGLEWVLESDSGSGSSGDHWTGQTGGQRR